MIYCDVFELEDSYLLSHPLLHDSRSGFDPAFLELRFHESDGQLRSNDWDIASLLQEIRQSADVILMSMGEEDCSNVTEAMTYRRPVRQDQVDPRLVLLREKYAAVDDEKFASMLDCGHIAADLSESAESDESHATVDKFRWCSEIGMRMVHEI